LGNTIIPDVKLPGYAITNFRVGLDEIAGTRFSLAGYVRNAFDRAYYVGGVAEGATAGINLAVPGEPRMFYVEGTCKF
jgi:iron complex outermembrane receptor protein